MKDKKTAKPESIEEIFTKLEALINELEAGKEPLDQVLTTFKQAVALYQKASGMLQEAKVKVTEMLKDLEGEKDGEVLKELVEPDSTDQNSFTL